MNSGKSTALLQAAYNYEERGQRVLLAKPVIDTKGDRMIVSRLGVSREVDLVISPTTDVVNLVDVEAERIKREEGATISCLLVDESQFLSPRQVDDLLILALRRGIPVLAYGIRFSNGRIPRFQEIAGGGAFSGRAQNNLPVRAKSHVQWSNTEWNLCL